MKRQTILKLDKHDEKKEIDFELAYLASLSIRQRFELMITRTREILTLLEQSGHRKPSEIIKRT